MNDCATYTKKMNDRFNILFITWDGPQVTYLESLFLPIFQELAKYGLDFHIMQFTWGDARRIEASRRACAAAGFTYQAETIWRRPLAAGSLLSALHGARLIRQVVRKHQIDAVMPRSTLPALATLLALRGSTLPMILDADGLPLDERVDFAGQSPTSLVYRFLRDIEAQAVRRADVVLTRSKKAVAILQARAGAGTSTDKFHVVRNGRDPNAFSPGATLSRRKTRRELGIDDEAPLLIYAGSLGPQYCLTQMLGLFAHVHKRRPDSRLLILTGSPEALPGALDPHPHLKHAISALTVEASDVPQYLACADLGLAVRRASFSMQAVAPIKLGEYLLCGLPVVASDDIGDTSTLVGPQVGHLLNEMGDAELANAADWFVDTVLAEREAFRERCRAAGLASFSLNGSVEGYRQALASAGMQPRWRA